MFLSAETRALSWNEPLFSWFSSNLHVAAALAERWYDVRLVVGDGEHTLRPGGNHGAVILPDALRRLWRSHAPDKQRERPGGRSRHDGARAERSAAAGGGPAVAARVARA